MTTADVLLQAEQAIWQALTEFERLQEVVRRDEGGAYLDDNSDLIEELRRVRSMIALARSGA